MKKSILFCAAVMMAASINATEKTVTIDLAQFQAIDANATAKLTDNELTVSYDLGEWAASGIECAINQQNVTNISFEFKGDATVDKWVSFFPYLKDAAGVRFYCSAENLNISTWMSAWTEKKFMPNAALWGSADQTPQTPYTAIGFLANPEFATKATFAIRNVKVYVNDTETALQTPATSGGVAKIVENGQVYILRDGVRYNALGAVVE